MSGKIYIDVEGGLARIRNNVNLYKRMLDMFCKSTEFQNFQDAIAAQDWNRAGDSAHTIKGMAGNLSLNAVFEESADLMTRLRSGPVDAAEAAAFGQTVAETLRQIELAVANL